jgi:HlyD family secretion protein
MKRKRFAILIAVLAAASAMGAWSHMRGRHGVEYRTAAADRGNITSTISATGNLNAVVTVEVGTQVSGNIKELYADFNTRVKKGQLVARIDPAIYEARVSQAQANVDAARSAVMNASAALEKTAADISNAKAQIAIAQANLAREKVTAADAKVKFNRQMELFQSGLIAAADRDTAQATYDAAAAAVSAASAQVKAAADSARAAESQRNIAKAQVAAAEAQVKQQMAALHQAQIDLAHTYIYAPVDGTVISRKVDAGQTVVASLQAPAIFQIAQDLTKMQVDTNVDEADVGHVQLGQQATFTVDAYPGRKFRGTVMEIRKAPINVQNVVTYDVVVAVDNPDLKLFPGMTANVNVTVDHRDDVLRVPNAALRFRPAEAKAATDTVYVVDENGQPSAVALKPGITDGVFLEVVDGDLKAGQRVITGLAQKEAARVNATPSPMRGGPRF